MPRPKKTAKASSRIKRTEKKAAPNPPTTARQRASARKTIPRPPGVRPGRGSEVGWHDKFLKALRQEPNISRAARIAGVDRGTATDHRERFPLFSTAWDEAIDAATDDLESVAVQISTKGLRRLKFDKEGEALREPGGKLYEEVEYPVALMCFLLKGRRKETYGDKLDLNTTQKPMSDEEALRMGELAADGLVSTIRASLGQKQTS
jgi:hypothetical protein